MAEDDSASIVRQAERGYVQNMEDAAERVKIQATIADRALQSMVLVHGGALIALFTFVGGLTSKTDGRFKLDWINLKESFACFAIGLICILIAHLFAFASQDRFYVASIVEAYRYERSIEARAKDTNQAEAIAAQKTGYAYFGLGIALFVISAGLFIGGCLEALTAFSPT